MTFPKHLDLLWDANSRLFVPWVAKWELGVERDENCGLLTSSPPLTLCQAARYAVNSLLIAMVAAMYCIS